MRPLLLLSICLLATAVPHVQARCPFAHLFEGEALEAPHDAGAGRELLQQRPRPGGQQPPQQQPPQQPPPPAAPCNIAALSAAAPFTPAGPASQGAVDLRVKQVAISVITAPATATPPGVGTAAAPNTGIPLGAFLRLAFHDVGTFNR